MKHNWTNQDLLAEVKKLPDNVELCWNYSDELNPEQIQTVFEGGIVGLYVVEMQLLDLNWEQLADMGDEALEGQLDSMRERGKVSAKCERRFRALAESYDRPGHAANARGLCRRTDARTAVTMNRERTHFEAWRGVCDQETVESLTLMCDTLNINPAALQPLVVDEGLEFPDWPDREGHEFVNVDDFITELDNTTSGGELTFPCAIPLTHLIDDREAYTAGPLVVRKGTPVMVFDSFNGSGSPGDAVLLHDLVLPAGSARLIYDDTRRYGMQKTYGFTGKFWRMGCVQPHFPKA